MGLFGGKKLAAKAGSASGASTPTASKTGVDRPGVVVDWIAGNASIRPDKVATIDLYSERRCTYAQMHERIARIAGHMRAQGVNKGDRVCVLSLNSTDMLDIQYACWRIGAIYLPLNFRLTAVELAFIVADAAPKIGFLDQTFAEVGAAIEKESPVGNWVMMDGSGGDTPFERIMTSAEPIYEMIDLSPDDLAMIMYSSGTTGRPKGVALSHQNMLFGGVFNGVSAFSVGNNAVGLSATPLFHIGGTNGFSTSLLYFGATSIIARQFDPGETLKVLGDPDYKVTHIFAVPAIFNALRVHPACAETDFSSLQVAAAGAETVPESLIRWWLERGVMIQEVYGMTETCGGACFIVKSDLPDKIGSAGKALRHAQFKIVDPETLQEVPRGEKGEILMRGPAIMTGYWNRPEANAEVFVDGWLRSGDIGRIDADGYVYVEDRVKDMYISGGENVYPAEVENVLYEIDAIAEVAVIGVPDSQWGEAGCAVIALKEGASLSLVDIGKHCEGRLATYKRPAHMAVIEALPRNATGKVLKFELRKSVPEKLELR